MTAIGISLPHLKAVDWATIVTAMAATIALVYASVEIRTARRLARQNLAYEYFARFNDDRFLDYLADTVEFLNVRDETAQEERWQEWQAKPVKEKLQLAYPLNLVEELAGLFNDSLVDRKIVEKNLGKTSWQLWYVAPWFVERARAEEHELWDALPDDWVDYRQWELMQSQLPAPQRRMPRENGAAGPAPAGPIPPP